MFKVPYKGKYIIYAPLKKTAFIGNAEMASLAGDLADGKPLTECLAQAPEAVEFIRKSGILSPDPAMPSAPVTEYKPASTTLFLTNRCNLRCVYCYASAGESLPEDMSLDTAQAAIDIAHANAVDRGYKSFGVSFHGGGEPTVNWGVFKGAVEHARARSLKAKITAASNGCYTKEQLDYILDNLDGLSLSFDGPPELQDVQRPCADGRPSSPAVMRTIREMDRRSFNYAIRMTVTPGTVDRLPQAVKFICENTTVKHVHVEPAFLRGRGKDTGMTQASIKKFILSFAAAYDIATAHGIRLAYSGARIDTLANRFCGAPSDVLVVLPRGELTACFEVYATGHPMADSFIFGRIRDRKLECDLDRWRTVAGRTVNDISYCRDCFCKYHCAGDCLSKSFSPGSADSFKASFRCKFNRDITRFLLLKKIAASDGLWRGPARVAKK